MEKVLWNSVNKRQNGLEQIENEKHKNKQTTNNNDLLETDGSTKNGIYKD